MFMGFAAVAAILIGGATVKKASISHVLIGTFLFQSLLVVALPVANKIIALGSLKVPIATAFLIVLLCLFNVFISKTKIGQDFKSVGQDMHIATVSGINANRIRVIAITLSTVLAAWGQNMFGDPQLGEFFRSFVAYGVIGISLGMHAWKQQMQAKNKLRV